MHGLIEQLNTLANDLGKKPVVPPEDPVPVDEAVSEKDAMTYSDLLILYADLIRIMRNGGEYKGKPVTQEVLDAKWSEIRKMQTKIHATAESVTEARTLPGEDVAKKVVMDLQKAIDMDKLGSPKKSSFAWTVSAPNLDGIARIVGKANGVEISHATRGFESAEFRIEGGFGESVSDASNKKILTEEIPAVTLGDLKAGIRPRLLEECMGASPSYDSYAPMSFEDKIRAAISQIKYAVQDEAMKGLGDDGRTLRVVDYQKEPSPWDAISRLISDNITVDGVKQLLPLAKDVLNKYLE